MKLLSKNHLFDQVHEALWDMIREGKLLPGQRMKDIEWAQRLNVSRTPVREAMRKMQQDGILLPLANGGYQVRDISLTDLTQIYRCRAALEAIAAEDAAERFDDSAEARLEKIIEGCDSALADADFQKVFAWNGRFQAAVLEMSDNSHMKELSEVLNRRILFYQSALLMGLKQSELQQSAYLERMVAKQVRRRAILKALVRRNGPETARLMQANVRLTGEGMREAFAAMKETSWIAGKVA